MNVSKWYGTMVKEECEREEVMVMLKTREGELGFFMKRLGLFWWLVGQGSCGASAARLNTPLFSVSAPKTLLSLMFLLANTIILSRPPRFS